MKKPKFKVYVDPTFPVDKILVGHKGDSFLDAGYVVTGQNMLWRPPPSPTVVERLAGVHDPEIQERVEKMDAAVESHKKMFGTFDMVPDPASEGAHPRHELAKDQEL